MQGIEEREGILRRGKDSVKGKEQNKIYEVALATFFVSGPQAEDSLAGVKGIGLFLLED